MKPIVTPEEMRAIDAEAPESIDVLIDRAGWATALAAVGILKSLGGVYGARVAVLAGKGNNGADGRSAAHYLERRGICCTVFDVDSTESDNERGQLTVGGRAGSRFDLVIDAAFGTGLRGPFWSSGLPVDVDRIPVLAVDIPSGINGLTGQIQGQPLQAHRTVTFAAGKPGLLFEPGRSLVGELEVADIGLDCSRANLHLMEEGDLDNWPTRSPDAHKWQHAVAVVGGSHGMAGAASLSSAAAMRAGAGYVVKARPVAGDVESRSGAGPVEAVAVSLSDDYKQAAAMIARCAAVVIGPGLAVDEQSQSAALEILGSINVSAVLDAGALQPSLVQEAVRRRDTERPLHVLTPHDGEFNRLIGRPPGPDRVTETRAAAAELGAVIVLKGPTTVVAHPDGRALLSVAGDQRLATAGTGDVLAGVIGAGLALGLDPFLAAGLGVELHGRAARLGAETGLTAGDLPVLVATYLSREEFK